MKTALYFGLDPSRFSYDGKIVHFPLIHIVPRPIEEIQKGFLTLPSFTHILLTSRVAARLLLAHSSYDALHKKHFLTIGAATAALITELPHLFVAPCPTAEGMIRLLEQFTWERSSLFYPHSALARPLIEGYLISHDIQYQSFKLYTALPNANALPNLDEFDELIFTSPSTVEAFAQKVERLPPYHKCRAIGPITQLALQKLFC